MSETVIVPVKIANEEYPISTPKSEEEILKESALRLDREIAKLREKGRLSLEKAAIMAGIILASELVRAEKGIELTEFKLREKIVALSQKVDEY